MLSFFQLPCVSQDRLDYIIVTDKVQISGASPQRFISHLWFMTIECYLRALLTTGELTGTLPTWKRGLAEPALPFLKTTSQN